MKPSDRSDAAGRGTKRCRSSREHRCAAVPPPPRAARCIRCAISASTPSLSTERDADAGRSRDESGMHAMRVRRRQRQRHRDQRVAVPLSRVSSTAITAGSSSPPPGCAAAMRSCFLSEDDYPSLLALIWRYGAPVVMLCRPRDRARAVARRGPLRPACRGATGRRAARWPSRSAAPASSSFAHGGAERCTPPWCARSTKRRRRGSRATCAPRPRSVRPRWRG